MGFCNLIYTAFIVTLVLAQQGNCWVTSNKVGGGVASNYFIQRNGTHFILNGKPHYLNGFNAFWFLYMASDPSTISKVTSSFQQASQHGLNLARTGAFNDGGYRALQISPGVYDENVFRGLDFVISEARKYGVKLILSLVNNWNDFGGRNKYVQWAREQGHNVKNDDDFYTHAIVKQYYKNHIKAVLTRINTLTGLVNKNDPTIFAWELMNEPRSNSSEKTIQDWVSEMAAYVKSIDSNHLLEIGLEGFYGESMKQLNPGGYLAGTDFISNNQVPQIDFATIHLYPDQWLPTGSSEAAQQAFVDSWVRDHIRDSNDILRKPILLAEFGKSSKLAGYTIEKRNSYFVKLYNAIYSSARSGGSCAGGIFWQLESTGMENFSDGYEVIFEESPSTADLVKQQSLKMTSLK